MMWNPITTVNFLPGEAIPAARAAHGAEAILAVLAIIIWHFYHVHIRHLNKSMFTGKLTREEMEHEHPAELARMEKAGPAKPIAPAELRKRQMIYLPIALVITAVFGAGIYFFIAYENTAISTMPVAETAPVYVPYTPTPEPTATAAPTASASGALTWTNDIGPMIQAKCGTCHGANSFTGLSYDNYADFMKGGPNGPVVIPGDSANSLIVNA